MYDGLTAVDEFLNKFERTVPEQQWFDVLKWALRVMTARWWVRIREVLRTGTDAEE